MTIPQATAFQEIDQIKKLLDQGHSIDEQDFGKRTGLLVAATLNDFDLVEFFISNGAFVSFYDQDNFEAIEFATEIFKKIKLKPDDEIEKWFQLFKNGIWSE